MSEVMASTKKEQVTTLLKNHVVSVRFYKKNGEEREMVCTLDTTKVPADDAEKMTKAKASRSKPEDLVTVWKLAQTPDEESGWRSFYAENIIEYGIHFG